MSFAITIAIATTSGLFRHGLKLFLAGRRRRRLAQQSVVSAW